MQGPKLNEFYIKITDERGDVVVEVKPSDSWRYWLPGVVPATPELVGFDLTPFNPHIGAKPYAKQWQYLMPDGLPAGRYHKVAGVIQTRDTFDLFWYFDGQNSPLRLPAGDYPLADFDFIVN